MQTVQLYTILFLLLSVTTAYSQFSPGDLTHSHANLEGMNNCTQCHDLGKKINGEKCLGCHALIRTRTEQKKGFHGSSGVRNKECIQCHTEHRGRGFDMIKWEGGYSNFVHDQTGYTLEGKHKTAKCESCHKPENIKDAAVRTRTGEGLSLSRTFLGLNQDCRGCHFDEHRNQFTESCIKCHDFEDWQKSAGKKFDHSVTQFPLTGRHSLATCVHCHVLIPNARKKPNGQTDADYMNFTDIKFDKCTACHTDPHKNRFGQKCEKCHVPGGWQNVTVSGFDHTRTNYPLTGKHLVVNCEKCHQPDIRKKAVFKNLRYEECTACHQDIHAGQFTARADKGKCESCHSTRGFVPSLFSINQHDQLKFRLTGAHVAVPCNQCHLKLSGSEFNRRTGATLSPADTAIAFRITATACINCHKDIHNGQFKDKIDRLGCEACHRTDSWNMLSFDHNKDSGFPLKGKHAQVICSKCHISSSGTKSDVRYKGLPTACESCHIDIHYGQFVGAEYSGTKCDRCHSESGFKPVIFDHTAQSRFSLSGAHQKVECAKCHRSVTLNNGIATIVYKPIDTKCSSCHANLK